MAATRQTFINFANLQAQLNVAGLQAKDPPLYQVISQLISANALVQSIISGNIATISQAPIISAGTSSRQLSSIVFSNSNGISFGLNSSTITGSFGVTVSAGTANANLNKVSFSNGSNVSFGLAGSTITASVATSLTNINVSASNTSVNLSNIVFSNSNGLSFGLSGSTLTGSVSANGNITFSAGTSTVGLNSLVFSNSNNVSFGLNGSTVTANASFSGNASVNFSAGATSNNLDSVVFSNSNNVSFGLSGSTITGSIATSLTNINISAGVTSNNLSNLVFANSNGVTFGLTGSTITGSVVAAAGGQTLSWYQNVPNFNNTIAFNNWNVSMIHVMPISIDINVSGNFLRGPWSNSMNVAGYATTSANTTWTAAQSITFAYVLYTLGAGASSLSLQSIYSNSAPFIWQTVGQAGTAGSRYTISYDITYPLSGLTSAFHTSFAASQASYFNSSNSVAQFLNGIFIDIPFSTSLGAGQYFIGYGISTSSNNTGAPGGIVTLNFSSCAISQSANFRDLDTGNTTRWQFGSGMGVFATNSAAFSTASINMPNISSTGSHPVRWVNIMRS